MPLQMKFHTTASVFIALRRDESLEGGEIGEEEAFVTGPIILKATVAGYHL